MELGTLFNFAILLFCGLIFAKIIRYFKLPDDGYLIGGSSPGAVSAGPAFGGRGGRAFARIGRGAGLYRIFHRQ